MLINIYNVSLKKLQTFTKIIYTRFSTLRDDMGLAFDIGSIFNFI